MKIGINIWVYFLILAGLSACDTKQDWFDSGISSPYHDCSIMEYLQKDTANWKLTVELIERAELTQLFEGKDPNYKDSCGIKQTDSFRSRIYRNSSGRHHNTGWSGES